MGEQLLHRNIVEIQGGLHQLGFILLHHALFLDGIQNVLELFFGDGRALVPLGAEAHHQPLQQLENADDWGEQNNQKMHRCCNGQCQLLAVFLRIGLGQDLTEDQHQHGGYGGGDHGTGGTEQGCCHGGHQGSRRSVDHIVAHQNGGEGAVKVFGHIQGLLGLFASIIRIAFQADLVYSGKGCFRCGEIG